MLYQAELTAPGGATRRAPEGTRMVTVIVAEPRDLDPYVTFEAASGIEPLYRVLQTLA